MKFLVGVDGSEASDRAFERAVRFANKEGDSVVVVAVVDVVHFFLSRSLGPQDTVAALETKAKANAATSLEKCKTRCEAAKVTCVCRTETGNPREVLVNVAVEEKVDVVLVGASGTSKASTLGSTAEFVMRSCACDVLITK